MQVPWTFIHADSVEVGEEDERVAPWKDALGVAAVQLGVVLTLAIAVHFACNLLFGR
jgi:hypothetical protein